MKELANKHGVEFLDLGSLFQDLLGEEQGGLHLSDGIHMDSEVYGHSK